MTLSIKRKIHKTRKRNRYRGGGIFWDSPAEKATKAAKAAEVAEARAKMDANMSEVDRLKDLHDKENRVKQLEQGNANLNAWEMAPRNKHGLPESTVGQQDDIVKARQTELSEAKLEVDKASLTCSDKKRKIKESLTINKIEAFLPDESNDVSKSRGDKLVSSAKRAEKVDAAIEAIGILGFVTGASVVIGPICSLTKTLSLGFSKYHKYREIAYLSSESLSFVANISKDLVGMNAFYSADIVKQKGIVIDTTIYNVLQKSLYKFLYFLIDSIDFTMTDLGPEQYTFWHSLLSKIDFDEKNYGQPIVANVYRYSCVECIPKELRKALLKESKEPRGNPKPLVNFKNVGSETEVKQGDSSTTFTSMVPRGLYDNMATRAAGDMYRGVMNKDYTYKKQLYGFCSEELVNLCKNDNDTVVRLIEYNMYKLIDTTYKNKETLFAELFANYCLDLNISKNSFYAYFFDGTDGDDVSIQLKSELETKREEIDYEKLIRRTALICYTFLVELRRIIIELDYKEFPKIVVKPQANSRYSQVIGIGSSIRNSGKSLYNNTMYLGSSYIGNPVTTYNQLLRDFIMMNGYFTSATSRYTQDFNKLKANEREAVLLEIEQQLKPVAGAFDVLIDEANKEEKAVVAATDDPQLDTQQASEPIVDAIQDGGKILHRRSKKYKRSKKLKSKRNKVKQNRN